MAKEMPKKSKGRPPVSPDVRRSKNFTFRSRASLHQKLLSAATAAERSISEEIEFRLDRSFIIDDGLSFGARITGWIIEIGHIIKTKAQGDPDWCEKPEIFDRVTKGVAKYFDDRDPRGGMTVESAEKPNSERPD